MRPHPSTVFQTPNTTDVSPTITTIAPFIAGDAAGI